MPTDFHWVFGHHAHLEFAGGGAPSNLSSSSNPQISTNEGCASISDSSGNLLFYTDGTDLWFAGETTPTLGANSPNGIHMGGNSSSTHSAIIVPPAGGGSAYHIFTMQHAGNPGPLHHMALNWPQSASGATWLHPPAPLPDSNQASEHLVAVPADDCRSYWIINVDLEEESLFVLKVTGDTPPLTNQSYTFQPYVNFSASVAKGFCAKASPNGKFIAFTNNNDNTIDIFEFNRATGMLSQYGRITRIDRPYGVEFSPNSQNIFFSAIDTGKHYGMPVQSGSNPAPSSSIFYTSSDITTNNRYRGGALQLGPDGKIYGIRCGSTRLFSIDTPDAANPTTQANVGFTQTAVDAAGNYIVLPESQYLGLPTFTRIADDCDDNCAATAAEVNESLGEVTAGHHNAMPTCNDEEGVGHFPGETCAPAEMPEFEPSIHITWGDSECDCIESDDTEVMTITVCNPYSNVSFSNFIIHKLTVTDLNGAPVATLPDGTPSITLVPIGPYCFGDIAGCSCVSREFTLRIRGAIAGKYRVIVSAICFDVIAHQDAQACFTFDICKD